MSPFMCCLSALANLLAYLFRKEFLYNGYIGVREGILLRAENFALKITICLKNKPFALKLTSEWDLKRLVNLFCRFECVYNGFVCNVNSPMT